MRVMKVFLGTKKVQGNGRIALDAAALKNANLRVGDEIEIYFDTDTSAILVEKPKQSAALVPRRTAAKGG